MNRKLLHQLQDREAERMKRLSGSGRRRRRAPSRRGRGVRASRTKLAALRKRAAKRGTGRRRRAPVRRRGRGLRGGAWGDRAPPARPAPRALPAPPPPPPPPAPRAVPAAEQKKSGWSTAAKAGLAGATAAALAYLGYKNRELPGMAYKGYNTLRKRTNFSKSKAAWRIAKNLPKFIKLT